MTAGESHGRQRVAGLAAGTGMCLIATLLAATSPATAGQPVKDVRSQTVTGPQHGVARSLVLFRVRTSLLATHYWYRQTIDGYPVVGGLYARHVPWGGESPAPMLWDGRRRVDSLDATRPRIDARRATAAALATPHAAAEPVGTPRLWVLPGSNGSARLVWAVHSADGSGATTTYVDAVTASPLTTVVVSHEAAGHDKFVAGRARVFDPNPVVKLQDESLTDQADSNDAVPHAGYSIRPLRHLDGSHSLVGRWVTITNHKIAQSPDNRYFYFRHNNKFEQVSAYYAADTEQTFLRSLGFTDVNAESQRIATDKFKADNSYYDPEADQISLGSGGVDDAEDPEVTWHEYGHAIQDDQVPGFGQSEQAGAIGEGFGDFMAVTMSQRTAKGTQLTPTSCIMDWDSTAYTKGPEHCLRTTVSPKTYPADLDGEVHDDGEIWSHALWDISRLLGRRKATTIVIEAQFSFNPSIRMPAAAKLTVATAQKLYGDNAATRTQRAFAQRGIL